MIKNKDFKIRASAASKLMAGFGPNLTKKQEADLMKWQQQKEAGIKSLTPKQERDLSSLIAKRDAPDELSAGAKSLLIEWKKDQIYKDRVGFTSVYTDKGNAVESEAIVLVESVLNCFIDDNLKRKNCSHTTGKGDGAITTHVLDIKSSFTSAITVPL